MHTLKLRFRTSTVLALFLVGAWSGCSKDTVAEHTGQSCAIPGDCYEGVKAPIKGDVVCLTRVPDGYCTHLCQSDADCCAVEGECKGGLAQVCSPFESTGVKHCFLSCESTIVDPTGMDSTAFCQKNASEAFSCRSSGGGSMNRKVCVPNG